MTRKFLAPLLLALSLGACGSYWTEVNACTERRMHDEKHAPASRGRVSLECEKSVPLTS